MSADVDDGRSDGTSATDCVGVTGAAGFLGWHMRSRLHLEGISCVAADRTTFSDSVALDEFVSKCTSIVHTAGVNRAEPDEVAAGNPNIATALVEALARTNSSIPIIYANSTHAEGDTVYGRSKRRAAEILADHQEKVGAPFLNLVLPHLFGEFGRPHYNSAVTTFAHELATGGTPEINESGRLELAHAQDVAAHCLAALANPAALDPRAVERFDGTAISVGEVWELMRTQHDRYVDSFTVPDFANRFELQIFNTLRSQLYSTGFYPRSLVQHSDDRGAFVELARSDGLGQTSLSSSLPGISRGDHFHIDKIERFVVVGGQARITMRRVLTDEVVAVDVSGDAPVFIDMPPLVTHKIENTAGSNLTTMFWAADHFDPAAPDTWHDPVEPLA